MMRETEEGGVRVPTNLRMLKIIEAITSAGQPLTPTEINRSVGLPKQSIHRLCNTLLVEGYLARDVDPKRLIPSRKLREWASGVFAMSHHQIARHQILMQVSSDVGETVNLVLPDENGMTYVDRVETNWSFRIQLPIGSHVPFHCTASGKTFLASLPLAARRSLARSLDLTKLTPNTIDNMPALLQELEMIGNQGFAVDNEEFMEGMVAIAVPIHDEHRRYFASLAFHGPNQRLSVSTALSKKDVLLTAAEKLRQVLFS